MPEAPLGIIDQQTHLVFPADMQIIPAIQRAAHGLLHIGNPPGIQRRRHLGRDAAVPRHHAVGREIVQRLVQHAETAGRVSGHAPAAQGAELEIRGLGAVELVQGVFLEEQRIAHAGGRAGKGTVAAHGHGIAVCRDAPVGEPVGGVAQLAGVDDILAAGTTPHPVVALGQVLKVGHPALHLHTLRREILFPLCAVHAHPDNTAAIVDKPAVKVFAARVSPQAQGSLGHIVHDAVAVQPGPLACLFSPRTGQGHGVPHPELRPDALSGHKAVVQWDHRPVARSLAVYLQRILCGIGLVRLVQLQKQLAVLRVFRLLRALVLHLVGIPRSITGRKAHAQASRFPGSTQRGRTAVGRIERHLVRKDQDLCADAHHRLAAVGHSIFHGDGLGRSFVRGINQVLPADGQ